MLSGVGDGVAFTVGAGVISGDGTGVLGVGEKEDSSHSSSLGVFVTMGVVDSLGVTVALKLGSGTSSRVEDGEPLVLSVEQAESRKKRVRTKARKRFFIEHPPFLFVNFSIEREEG